MREKAQTWNEKVFVQLAGAPKNNDPGVKGRY